MINDKIELLSDGEMQSLVVSVVMFSKEDGATREQIDAAVDWAENVRLDEILLRNVLSGVVAVRVRDDGEVEFRNIDDPTEKQRIVDAALIRRT